MKFSEALILGSTVTEYKISNGSWTTCLCGVAVKGLLGAEASNWFNNEGAARWPWLKNIVPDYDYHGKPIGTMATGEQVVTTLCAGVEDGLITLERAVDIIQKIESQAADNQDCTQVSTSDTSAEMTEDRTVAV